MGTVTYGYDSLNRLASASSTGGWGEVRGSADRGLQRLGPLRDVLPRRHELAGLCPEPLLFEHAGQVHVGGPVPSERRTSRSAELESVYLCGRRSGEPPRSGWSMLVRCAMGVRLRTQHWLNPVRLGFHFSPSPIQAPPVGGGGRR